MLTVLWVNLIWGGLSLLVVGAFIGHVVAVKDYQRDHRPGGFFARSEILLETKPLKSLLQDCWDVAHSYSAMGLGSKNEKEMWEIGSSIRSRINDILNKI